MGGKSIKQKWSFQLIENASLISSFWIWFPGCIKLKQLASMVGVPHVTTISWNKCVESIHSWCLFTFSWSFSSDSPSFGIELILFASSLSTSGLVSSFNRSCFRLFNISLSISASNSGDLPIFVVVVVPALLQVCWRFAKWLVILCSRAFLLAFLSVSNF